MKRPSNRRRHKRPQPLREAEVEIMSVGARGDGVAEVSGEQVFVPLTAPGDVARISHGGGRGVIKEILKSGDVRAEPDCFHYGECGGCALQHVDKVFYRSWKRQLVIDALARAGFEDDIVAPVIFCPPASRLRATFACVRLKDRIIMGFNARASKIVVPITDCKVLAPALLDALPSLQSIAEAAPKDWRKFGLQATLTDTGLDICLQPGAGPDTLAIKDITRLTEAARKENIARLSVNAETLAELSAPVVWFGDVTVTPPPGGFLQASREGEAALQKIVCDAVAGAKIVGDLFSGCGTFALPMAHQSAVSAFDSESASIKALQNAANTGNLAKPVNAGVRNLFDRPLLANELKKFDAVVFDPPRAGAKAQAEEIAAAKVPVVVGVSCNPSTFARDAKILRDGGYVLTKVTPVDQFVYSPHVELVGVFEKS